MTDIYEFLQTWGPQKLESMRDCPIKNYVMLVSCLNVWQARVSNIPNELITKSKLLLLSCHDVRAEMGECCLLCLLSFRLLIWSIWPFLGLECPPGTLGAGPSLDLQSFPQPQVSAPFLCCCRCEHYIGLALLTPLESCSCHLRLSVFMAWK